MNDTLMQQCRREAEEAKPWHPELRTVIISEVKSILGWGHEQAFYERAANNLIVHAEVAAVKAYAAALYHERSKRPPTVDGQPMITVEAAIAIVQDWAFERRDWHIQNTVDREDLRNRLTAAATNKTNDNGATS